MDIFNILDNIMHYINKYSIPTFKLGFVGNGEPLLDYENLKKYILYISKYLADGRITAYIITNGLLIDEEKLLYFNNYNVNVGFSIDGLKEVHNKWRCGSFDKVMEKIKLYKSINGKYPSMNCTVGKDVLEHTKETINFFKRYQNKITFSRMIGNFGVSLKDYKKFIEIAKNELNIRTGSYDCTMYGGLCGAGMDNIFYANGKIFICGNCVDLDVFLPSTTSLDMIDFDINTFDRHCCYKEACVK